MDALLTTVTGRATLLVAVLTLTCLAWWLVARRSGTMRVVGAPAADVDARPAFDLAAIGATGGTAATFVQFSSAVCSPCRSVARVLSAISAEETDVVHVEIDAATHPGLVRSHGILRTPTVLLLGPDGRVRGRSTGPMTAVQARAALATLGHHPVAPSAPAHLSRSLPARSHPEDVS